VGPLGRQGSVHKQRGYGMKRFLVVAASVAVLVGAAASGAFAGEVKGPPGTPCGGPNQPACDPSTNTTAAEEHSNSACSFSGLNDMNPENGPTQNITQTPGNQGAPGAPGHGAPGFPNGCRGGSNPDNPPGS
jgi:hypothetical protein